MADAPDLSTRLALTVAEAAAALGVSERHLRQLLPEIPHLHVGRRVVIPVEPFREYLRARCEAERGKVDQVVEDILSSV